jgi:hypothetical protein
MLVALVCTLFLLIKSVWKRIKMKSIKLTTQPNLKSETPPEFPSAIVTALNTQAPKYQEAFQLALEVRKKQDPLIGAKIGGPEILLQLMNALRDQKGIHIESLICALGSLAGYACQSAARMYGASSRSLEDVSWVEIKTNDGRLFFSGDSINKPLVEAKLSVWSLAAGQAQHLGCKELLDIHEVFEFVIRSIGNEKFGKLRVVSEHQSRNWPIQYVNYLWEPLLPMVKRFCPEPEDWPLLYGFAIQGAISQGKDILDPCLALKIAMESAVPMSKIDLATT